MPKIRTAASKKSKKAKGTHSVFGGYNTFKNAGKQRKKIMDKLFPPIIRGSN